MPDKWYETPARSSCTGVSLRWVAGAVDDTLIHVLSGAIEVTALKYGHVPRAVGIRMHLAGFGRTAEAGRRLLGLSGSRSCRSQRMLTGALAAFDERIKSSEAREFEL